MSSFTVNLFCKHLKALDLALKFGTTNFSDRVLENMLKESVEFAGR
jgi:hypothetical protein